MTDNEKVKRGQAVEFLMTEEGFYYIDKEIKTEIDNLKNSLIYGDFSNLEARNSVRMSLEFIESLYRKIDKWIKEKDEIVAQKIEDNSDLKPRR